LWILSHKKFLHPQILLRKINIPIKIIQSNRPNLIRLWCQQSTNPLDIIRNLLILFHCKKSIKHQRSNRCQIILGTTNLCYYVTDHIDDLAFLNWGRISRNLHSLGKITILVCEISCTGISLLVSLSLGRWTYAHWIWWKTISDVRYLKSLRT